MMEYKFNTLDEKYSEITPEILELTKLCLENSTIDAELYTKYKVNRGLRDLNGNGVLTGLTEISEIQAFDTVDGEKTPCEGKLFYRGIDIEDFVDGFIKEKRFGFEEAAYLLIFGKLPHDHAACRFLRPSGPLPHASDKLCKGHHYEVPYLRYDEHPGQKRPDAPCL
jgi:citrate synthase